MSDITWFGHSAFKISAPDAQVIIDPFFAPSAGVTADAAGDVDIVLVTHDPSVAAQAQRTVQIFDGLIKSPEVAA